MQLDNHKTLVYEGDQLVAEFGSLDLANKFISRDKRSLHCRPDWYDDEDFEDSDFEY